MGVVLALVAGVVSLLAYFYDRHSDTDNGKALGIWLLLSIVVSTGIGGYVAWSSDQELRKASEREEQIRQETRLGQTLLAMQSLDLRQPFDYGALSFSTSVQEMSNVRLHRPYGNLHRGIAVEGPAKFTSIDISVNDLWSYSADYETTSDGGIVIVQGRRDSEEYPQLSYDSRNSTVTCLTPRSCENRAFLWWEEHLASADGQFHQGFQLPDLSEHPAALYLSLVQETSELGTIRVARPDTPWWQPDWLTDRSFRKLMTEEVRASILFIQDGDITTDTGQCRNRVEFPLNLEPYSDAPPWRTACNSDEICFVVRHEQNPRITFCEATRI